MKTYTREFTMYAGATEECHKVVNTLIKEIYIDRGIGIEVFQESVRFGIPTVDLLQYAQRLYGFEDLSYKII